MQFASDNTGGVHPRIMAALIAANETANMPSYGADALTAAAQDRIREVFEAPEACVHFVTTGCAANSLALSLFAPGWGRVFCHQTAHIQTSEAGAPEFYTGGAKLVPLAGAGGKIGPDTLRASLKDFGRDSVHNGRNTALSLTNATEEGRIYTPTEIAALAELAHGAGMGVHLDGARFANALSAQNVTPAQLSWQTGVDVLTLGATKDGCMAAEAVIIFDPAQAEAFEYRSKRGGHLLSKHRFLAAQILGWLEDGLWLDLAAHANAMARRLGQGLVGLEGVTLNQPVETNGVFVTLPRKLYQHAQAAGASFHVWPGAQFDDGHGPVPLRMICGWHTQAVDVDAFLTALA